MGSIEANAKAFAAVSLISVRSGNGGLQCNLPGHPRFLRFCAIESADRHSCRQGIWRSKRIRGAYTGIALQIGKYPRLTQPARSDRFACAHLQFARPSQRDSSLQECGGPLRAVVDGRLFGRQERVK